MTKHANGGDWWLVVSHTSATVTQLDTYLILPDTIIGPVHQIVHAPCAPNCYWYREINFSLDGSIFFESDSKSSVNFYQFDRCTGALVLWKSLDVNPSSHYYGGNLLSRNNRYFYVGQDSIVVQYDLWVDDIQNSGKLLLTEPLSGGMPNPNDHRQPTA